MSSVEKLYHILITWQNLAICGSAWCFIQWLNKLIPKFMNSRLGRRLKPVGAGLLCSICMWIPELGSDHITGVGSRILFGIMLGALVVNLHSIVKHTIFGKFFHGEDKRTNDLLRELVNTLIVDEDAKRMLDAYFKDPEFKKMVDEHMEKKGYPHLVEPESKKKKKRKALIKKLQKILT